MSRIELRGINKYYGRNHVLKDINLVIEDGEFMTLLGPSGCGKTTTLRVVAGLEKPQEGYMYMGDREIVNAPEKFYEEPGKRHLNLVFQSYALWPHMTVFDNVAFGLEVAKVPKEEIRRKVENALKRMRIEAFIDRYPSELSGGQQQRVAIARAIVSEPEVLLLDEPLSNLDAKLRNQMRTELIELHKQLGTTFVYVTHDQTEAMSMATDIVLMNKGVIQQHDSPLNIYSNPENLFTAQFIGNPTMNLFPCRRMEGLIDMPPGAETVGFRPSKVRLLEAGEEIREGDLVTGGPILTRELFGSEIIYRINAPFGVITFKTFNEEQLPVNMVVKVAVPVGSMYFFDAQERRLK